MPDSQKHRPGVETKLSRDAYIAKRLKEAADLEQKLKANMISDLESAKIQIRLCEAFGDIIISNPVEAKKNDVHGRLWNVCFYSSIKQLRTTIGRARRRKDQEAHKRLSRDFRKRCDDGIELYNYLGDHFREVLRPLSSQSQTQDSGTQDSSASTDDSLDGISESLDGVVESFFKVYIYLGDLHRYGENFSKAEECYYNAAKLAPGKGNPYNQLAVVTQTKDPNMSCNALHWYCRSILATHQSFVTSPDNLERLFESNELYLKEHSRSSKPPIYKAEQKRKSASELVRAQQQAATKSCLAHFINALRQIIKSRKRTDADVDEETLRSKLSDVMASFESLLQVTAFSDALLFKIVQICVFVYDICKDETPISRELSRDFLFMTGATLATRLNSILTRMLDKDRAGTIRFLLPYQILCEYMSQIEDSEGKEYEIFWKNFAEIANLVLILSIRSEVAPNSYVHDGDVNVPLKEYQQLRGYRPFDFLYKSYAQGNPYISPAEAADALDILQSSQEHVRPSAADINTTKIARFLAICTEYAEHEKFPVSFADDKYSFVEKEAVQDEGLDEPVDGADFRGSAPEVSDDDDDAGDVVMLKAVEEGNTDAPSTKQLPPPAAAALGNPNVAVNRESETIHVAPPAEALPPPAALLPPPGFTAPMHNPASNQVRNPLPPMPPQQYPAHPGVYGQVVPGHQMLPTPPPPPPGMTLPGITPLQGVPATGINGNVPFGQAWQIFGGPSSGLQTANPFAGAMPNGFGYEKPAPPMFEDQQMTSDGTSLLDSALIDSLFMNDTTTNNPWK